MPFPAAPKSQFQGNRPPAVSTAAYPIIAARGTVIATSVIPASSAITLVTGDVMTASLQRTGTMPGGGAYPRVVVHTYAYQRNGAAGDVLGATLPNLQSHPLNVDMLFRLVVTNAAGVTQGQSTATLVRFV